jgi:hypothetical protein
MARVVANSLLIPEQPEQYMTERGFTERGITVQEPLVLVRPSV